MLLDFNFSGENTIKMDSLDYVISLYLMLGVTTTVSKHVYHFKFPLPESGNSSYFMSSANTWYL